MPNGSMRRLYGAARWAARTLVEHGLLPEPVRLGLVRLRGRAADAAEYRRQRRTASRWAEPPAVGIVLLGRGTGGAALRRTTASVLRQTFPRWALYVVPAEGHEAGGAAPPVPTGDRRVRRWRAPAGAAGAAACNAAIEAAEVDFVTFATEGDVLTPDALYRAAELLRRDPGLDVVYTDEAPLRASPDREPSYKPDWSPEHAVAAPYVGRLCLYRRSLVQRVGGLRAAAGPAAEHDLLLRLVEHGARVGHVRGVLYLRAAEADADPAAVRRVVADHLERTGTPADVGPAAGGAGYRVRFRIRGEPLVSIVIPTVGTTVRDIGGRSVDLLANTVRSITERTAYRRFEFVYVHDRPLTPDARAALADAGAAGVPVRGVRFDRPFNWSDKMNVGAAAAAGEHLLALNDDVEVISPDWLSALLEYSQQPAVGAVGAKLFYASGEIQHAGIVLPPVGAAWHVHYRTPPDQQRAVADLSVVRNYSAVTGACLMTRADVFREVGGFDPTFPLNYNDTDYCMRVRAHGYRVVFTPYAELCHYESLSRADAGMVSLHPSETERFRARWAAMAARDPYHQWPDAPGEGGG